MQGSVAARSVILLVAGAVVVGSLALSLSLVPSPAPSPQATMGFWEAAARGFVSVVMVNESFTDNGHPVTQAAGIRVTNTATVPVVISEEPVLMSPHPSQSPPPNPLATTQDAILTAQTIPAGGSVVYSYGAYVVQRFLPGPAWWCLEQMQEFKAGVVFRVGGETLPFALRSLLQNPYYKGPNDNTQTALWSYLRSHPAVVVGKLPLWSSVQEGSARTVRVRIDATNVAVWSTDDTFTQNVNVTHGAIVDDVPVGWTVEGGSFSVQPDSTVTHANGSQTLTWYANLPGAQVSQQANPQEPTTYETVTRFYTLVSPQLAAGNVTLPRSRSDMGNAGTSDAQSAAPILAVLPNPAPIADAGGPYTGYEGDTILLNASKSHDPDGEPLQFRWSYTDNGTWDTQWSSNPTAAVRYTDEFSGRVRVEATDGGTMVNATAPVTIANVPPTIRNLTASASADFRLVVAGRKSNTVTVEILANGTTLATLRVVRQPGDPKAQSASSGMLTMNLSDPISVRIGFSSSGECEKGANPTWLNITFPDGTSVVLFRNFHARDEDDEGWHSEDLRPVFFEHGITFRANLFDPGSDTLTAHWDFGNGVNVTQVFPSGTLNDAPESPVGGHAPMNVTATIVHGLPGTDHEDDESEGPGSFTVTLTVADGDGGIAVASLTLLSGLQEDCSRESGDD